MHDSLRLLLGPVRSALTGWAMLSLGLALVAMLLVLPAHQAQRHLTWQRDLMRLQADHLRRQRVRFEQFHEAMLEDDPVVLERLAFTQLRQKPAGQTLLELPVLDPAAHHGWTDRRLSDRPPADGNFPGLWTTGSADGGSAATSGSVDAWLLEPLAADVPRPTAWVPPGLYEGRGRLVLTGIAALCLVWGLIVPWPRSR